MISCDGRQHDEIIQKNEKKTKNIEKKKETNRSTWTRRLRVEQVPREEGVVERSNDAISDEDRGEAISDVGRRGALQFKNKQGR